MLTTIVQIRLNASRTQDELKTALADAAPKYQQVEGLVRKYFIAAQDGQTVGGVYLWKSHADAERLFTDEWRQTITEKYGTEPSIMYFNSPVIVDNLTKEILVE